MLPIKISKKSLCIDLGVVALMVVTSVFITLSAGLGSAGIYHPDEIFQALEPAHTLVYGYGLSAWEWEFGARNWALPGVLAGVLGVARVLGFDRPEGYLDLMRVFVSCIFASSGFAVYLLARQFRASRLLSVAAAAIFLFNPVTLALGFRTLSEVISTPFVLFGLVGALRAEPLGPADAPHRAARRWFILGISLLSVAVLFRLQNAVFALAVVLPWRFDPTQRARYELAMKVLVAWALVYGAIDWVSWGVPFGSAGVYIRFNLLMDGAAENFGTSPAYYYLQTFFSAMGGVGVALLGLALLAAPRARVLLGATLAFLLMHSLFGHKEFRFVLTTIPIFAALSAVGLGWARERWIGENKQLIVAFKLALGIAVLVATAWGVDKASHLTMGEMGAPDLPNIPASAGVYDNFAPVNRLLIRASERADICGLYLPEYMAVETGGHTYFHREVPFYHAKNRPPQEHYYNYVIARAEPRPGWGLIESDQAFGLYRTQPGACARWAGYQRSLFPEPAVE